MVLDPYRHEKFILCHHPSLTVQEVEISREHEDREKQWVITWSMKSKEGGIGPVKPVHIVFSHDESFLSRLC